MPSAYSLTDVAAEESWNSNAIVGCSFHTAVLGGGLKNSSHNLFREMFFFFYFKLNRFQSLKAHMKQNTAYLCKIHDSLKLTSECILHNHESLVPSAPNVIPLEYTTCLLYSFTCWQTFGLFIVCYSRKKPLKACVQDTVVYLLGSL